ncbi:DUF6053 domain-containing protein [Lysobacter enzymogenes]
MGGPSAPMPSAPIAATRKTPRSRGPHVNAP